MKRYVYIVIAILSGIFLSSCENFDQETMVSGKVAYLIAYIDTVHNETTFVETPAAGASLYLVSDPNSEYPYTGPTLETTSDSLGNYTFVVEPIANYEGFPKPSNIGVKVQAWYFDDLLGPGYGEVSGYSITPGKDASLPTIYLEHQAE